MSFDEISSHGGSESWQKYKSAANNIFQQWLQLQSDFEGAQEWGQLTETQVCNTSFFGRFGKYLLDDYRIPAGNKNAGAHLGVKSVSGYLASMVNLASGRFKTNGCPATKLFFTVLEPQACPTLTFLSPSSLDLRIIQAKTDAAAWFRGVKSNIARTCFERAVNSGDKLDTSESAIRIGALPACPCCVCMWRRRLRILTSCTCCRSAVSFPYSADGTSI